MVEVLLVEDNPGDVRLVKEALRDARIPANVTVVTDGEAALQYIRQQGQFVLAKRPDLILLDLGLPKLHGHEVLERIKQDHNLRCIPVIVLSGSQAEQDVARSFDLNSAYYLSKPVDAGQLHKVVETVASFWNSKVRRRRP